MTKATKTHLFQPLFLFTDEVIFSPERHFNQHNVHMWNHIIPIKLQKRAIQQHFSVTYGQFYLRQGIRSCGPINPSSITVSIMVGNIVFFSRRYYQNYSRMFLRLFGVLWGSRTMTLQCSSPNSLWLLEQYFSTAVCSAWL